MVLNVEAWYLIQDRKLASYICACGVGTNLKCTWRRKLCSSICVIRVTVNCFMMVMLFLNMPNFLTIGKFVFECLLFIQGFLLCMKLTDLLLV